MPVRRPAALLALVAMLVALLPAVAPPAAATTTRWSDPATWGGAVPGPGASVTVPAGRTVVLDVSPPPLVGLQVDGTLRFARRNLTVRTGSVIVNGRLEIGTAASPFTQRAQIVLDGPRDANVMGLGANVLGVRGGGVLDIHGAPRPVRWTRLAQTARRGAAKLVVQGTAKGWRRGDRVVVASTTLDPAQAEERRIVRRQRNVVTLDRPLRHTHWGASQTIAGKVVSQRAEVGLLSRNIVIRGGDRNGPAGFGGHIISMPGATVRVKDVELAHMGQAGVMARYPFHFHMMGSAPNSYFRSSVVRNSNSRCVTVHGTSDVTVADNVAYDAKGHCYFFEDGAERGVKLQRNLGVLTRAPKPELCLLDTDHVPGTFWIQHPDNIVTGNAAAGSDGNGFWYDLPEHPTGLSATTAFSPRRAKMGVFRGNVAHSNINRRNRFRSGSGLLIEDYHPQGEALFSGITAYKNSGFGVWAENRVTVAGARLYGNNVGFLGRNAALRSAHIVGSTANEADKLWSMTGVGMYHDTADVQRVTFANFKPYEWRHGVAIGSIVEDISAIPRFAKVRFRNAHRVRLTPPWITDRVGATALTDVDGTVTGSGKPSTLLSSNPLIVAAGCRRDAGLRAHVCSPRQRLSMVRVQDHSGNRAAVGPVSLVRDDGNRYRVPADHSWADRPQAQGTVRLDRRYTVKLGRKTPANLEWVVANEVPGWVELAVDWPYESVHVYDGWGEWARRLTPVTTRAGLAQGGRYWRNGGKVHVRFSNDGEWRWLRQKICAQQFCGEGLGTRGLVAGQ